MFSMSWVMKNGVFGFFGMWVSANYVFEGVDELQIMLFSFLL